MAGPIVVQIEPNPIPECFGDETLLTVSVARSLANDVATLYLFLDKNHPHSWDDLLRVTIAQDCLARISPKLDWLEYLLYGRGHRNHLRKLYQRTGIEFGGRRFLCAADASREVALELLTTLVMYVFQEVNTPLVGRIPDFTRVTPVLQPDNLAVFAELRVQQALSEMRPDHDCLAVLLENEELDIGVVLGDELSRKPADEVVKSPQGQPSIRHSETDRDFAGYSRTRTKSNWVEVLKHLGHPTSITTFSRDRSSGKFIEHPSSKPRDKTIRLRLDTLPAGYTDDLPVIDSQLNRQ